MEEGEQINSSPIIYLETPAITPMFANYDNGIKISKLFSIIEKESALLKKPHPFGLCIDTAHIWTSGNDISTYDGAKRWFTELMDMPYIPHDKIIIHLNDSERDLGHGPDRHASLTEGKIWNSYKTRAELRESGLCFILEFAHSNNIPIILERGRKEMLKNDYQILQKFAQM
jgi:deoxyribonuclease-4